MSYIHPFDKELWRQAGDIPADPDPTAEEIAEWEAERAQDVRDRPPDPAPWDTPASPPPPRPTGHPGGHPSPGEAPPCLANPKNPCTT